MPRRPGLAYVAIIPCDYQVTLPSGAVIRADEAVKDAVFERRSCGNGSKGPRYSDWAMTATADPAAVPADPPADLPPGPADVLPVLGAGGQAGDHDLFHHHRRAPLAGGSRPPLLPVKRDLSFTAALLVLLPAFLPVSAWGGAQRARV